MKSKTIKIEDLSSSSEGLLTLELEGTSPLIMNNFWNKGEMLRQQVEGKKTKLPPKDPDKCFVNAIYVLSGTPRPKGEADLSKKTRYGFPACAFKSAFVRAAKLADMNMTDARAAMFVEPDDGELVEIIAHEKPTPRVDPVRNANSGADVRVRPEFRKWGVKLRVRYNLRAITVQQLVTFAISAGRCVGVGEWRPMGRSSSGVYGCWKVVSASALEPDVQAVA